MKGHRTCIICLPRSGSQFCEKLISGVHNAYQLGEYFEAWNESEYKLDSNNNIVGMNYKMKPSHFAVDSNYQEKLNFIKAINKDQPLTVRLFLMSTYDTVKLGSIISQLHDMGFEFVTLFRNLTDQLLSYMIAYEYREGKNKDVFTIDSPINELVTIHFTSELKKVLYMIKVSSVQWENNLSIVMKGIPYQNVSYESIISDMETVFETKFNYSGSKSITVDPFELIENKIEVLEFLGK